jgi:hypothetical protein
MMNDKGMSNDEARTAKQSGESVVIGYSTFVMIKEVLRVSNASATSRAALIGP